VVAREAAAGGSACKTGFERGGFRSIRSTCWRRPWIISSIWRICSLDLLIQMSRGSAWAPGALIGKGCGRTGGVPSGSVVGWSQSATPPKMSTAKTEPPSPRIRSWRCFGDSLAIVEAIRLPGDSAITSLQDDQDVRAFTRFEFERVDHHRQHARSVELTLIDHHSR
jgi:hypothetical protein